MNALLFVLLSSKKVQILKTEYKYGQYCTPLSQSDCRYFFVLAINQFILNVYNCYSDGYIPLKPGRI